MMKPRGNKKERPDGGQEERGGTPHGKPIGSGMNGERKGGRLRGEARGQKRKSGHSYPLFRWGAMPRSRRPVKRYSIDVGRSSSGTQPSHLSLDTAQLNSTRQLIWGSRSAHDTTIEKFTIVSRWHRPVRAPNRIRDGRAVHGGMQSFSRFRFRA